MGIRHTCDGSGCTETVDALSLRGKQRPEGWASVRISTEALEKDVTCHLCPACLIKLGDLLTSSIGLPKVGDV